MNLRINSEVPLRVIFLLMLGGMLGACEEAPAELVISDQDVKAGVAATLTKQAFVDSVDSFRLTETALNLPTNTPEPTWTPQSTSTYTPSPEPDHYIIPGAPTTRNNFVTDLITVDLAKDKTALGDNYVWSKMERPYTPEDMEYRGYLDIMRVDIQEAAPWMYLTFVLVEDLPETAQDIPEGEEARYAVELDTDHDGSGDTLVMVDLPPDSEWTTDGVMVMADEDDDIGGLYPLYEDTAKPGQNGYEIELFLDGEGEDPDLAWVRRDPDEQNQLQIAFKKTLIGEIGMIWTAWTDGGLMSPSLFDFNDHFSFEAAGSPNKENYRYPVKAVALVDSTCRSWYGFIPTGKEPGLCYTSEQSKKEYPGLGYCVATFTPGGCEGKCLPYCPGGQYCVPCRLP